MTNKTIKKQLVFFIFLLYYTYSGPASIRETDDEKKHLHLVKYEPIFLYNIIYRSNIL